MPDQLALLLATLTSILWGLTGVFVKLLPPLSPLVVAGGRLVIALAAMLPFLLVSSRLRRSALSSLRQPVAYLLAGLLAGYYLLATAAFQLVPVAEAALLLATPPLFVLLFRRLSGDHPVRAEIFGAMLALAGLLVVLLPRLQTAGGTAGANLFGDVLALLAAAATAYYAFRYRAAAFQGRAPDVVGVMLLTLVLGSAALTALVLAGPGAPEFADIGRQGLLTLIGLGVLSTAIPTAGFAFASKRLPPILTAIISLFIPIFAALFGVVLLDEPLTVPLLAGATIVLCGVAVIVRAGAAR